MYHSVPRRFVRLVAVLALLGALLGLAGQATAQTSGFPPVGTNFAASGPYQVSSLSGSQHTYYYPSNLRSTGLQHPVILWGNGTGASPSSYDGLLRHFASHGFVVAAANTPNAGSGTQMRAGLDNLAAMRNQSSSPFYQAVDVNRAASTGHSQGGVGALAAARDDARVVTTFPIEGAFSAAGVSDPILFLAGERDTIARPSQIRSTYQGATAPAAYAEVRGASHFTPAGDGGFFRAAGVAWARWHLMDDSNARGWFVGASCGLCSHSSISDYEVNARFRAAFGSNGGGPGDPDPGQCVRSSTRTHVSNDRAVSVFGRAYARGSSDSLGSVSLFNIVSLRETGPNHWTRVSSC